MISGVHTSDPTQRKFKSLTHQTRPRRAMGGHSPTMFIRTDLSEREIEVLLAWLRADSKEEAARALFISSSTVSTHISRIRTKYAAVGRPARSKASLFARALQDGFTTLGDW